MERASGNARCDDAQRKPMEGLIAKIALIASGYAEDDLDGTVHDGISRERGA